VRSEGLGLPVPISLVSDPSELQGDEKMIFYARQADRYDRARSKALTDHIKSLGPNADAKAKQVAEEQDEIARMEFVASMITRIDNWDGEVNITDPERISEIIKQITQPMLIELIYAINDYKELLRLKNQSASGSKAGSSDGRKSPSAATTHTTAEPVSLEAETKSESAGDLMKTGAPCNSITTASGETSTASGERPSGTLPPVT